MKYIFIFFIALTFTSCKKDNVSASGEFTDVIYEIQTSDIGFTYVKTVEYDPVNGPSQNTAVDWPITSAGTLKKTVRIKRGFRAEITAAHPSSDKWKLIIRNADGQMLASSTPTFSPPPLNSYYSGFSIVID